MFLRAARAALVTGPAVGVGKPGVDQDAAGGTVTARNTTKPVRRCHTKSFMVRHPGYFLLDPGLDTEEMGSKN